MDILPEQADLERTIREYQAALPPNPDAATLRDWRYWNDRAAALNEAERRSDGTCPRCGLKGAALVRWDKLPACCWTCYDRQRTDARELDRIDAKIASWTEEREAIAARMGRSRGRPSGALAGTPDERATVVREAHRLRAEGHSWEAIAGELGRASVTIQKWAEILGEPLGGN